MCWKAVCIKEHQYLTKDKIYQIEEKTWLDVYLIFSIKNDIGQKLAYDNGTFKELCEFRKEKLEILNDLSI